LPLAESEPAKERPRPNIRCIGGDIVSLEESPGGIVERGSTQNGIVIRFSNDAKPSAQNVGAPVKASLRYLDGDIELCAITGCYWIGHYEDFATFQVEGRYKLLAGMLINGTLTLLAKRRINAHRRTYFDVETHPLKNFQAGTLVVRLTNADNGDWLFERHFAVNVSPLTIEPL
jgi:hypothetical protein